LSSIVYDEFSIWLDCRVRVCIRVIVSLFGESDHKANFATYLHILLTSFKCPSTCPFPSDIEYLSATGSCRHYESL